MEMLTPQDLYRGLKEGHFTTSDEIWSRHPHEDRVKAWSRYLLLNANTPLTVEDLLFGLEAGAFMMSSDLATDPMWLRADKQTREIAYAIWEKKDDADIDACIGALKVSRLHPNSPVAVPLEKCFKCIKFQLANPFLIAMAVDRNIAHRVTLTVTDDVLNGGTMNLGQDALYGNDRAAPQGQSVGTEEDKLKAQMRKLLDVFAQQDADGKAKRLFETFLKKNNGIVVFSDSDLDRAVESHSNFIAFMDRTMAAPGTSGIDPSKIRIHQALRAAGWDINQVKLIGDLGVPAFNLGSKFWATEDFASGLGVMINSVQYVYVYVESYHYDVCVHEYNIGLKFVVYDVFGLDDDDLDEYGASGAWYEISDSDASRGITAWWQLQHQFNYAPVLTRAVVRRNFVVSTLGP